MAATTKTWQNNQAPSVEDVDLNGFKEENNNLIVGSGQALNTGDRQQTQKAVSAYAHGGNFYTDSGTANSYILSVIGSKIVPADYFDGMQVRFIPSNTNTSVSTVKVGSLATIPVKLYPGQDVLSGAIRQNEEITLIYQSGEFVLSSESLDVFKRTATDYANLRAKMLALNSIYKSGDSVNIVSSTKTGLNSYKAVLVRAVGAEYDDNGGTVIVASGGTSSANELVWLRGANGTFFADWFNPPTDDVDPDSPSIIAAINACSAAGGGEVVLGVPSVAWRIEEEVSVPVDVDLRGIKRNTYVTVRSGTYPNGYAILSNTTNGVDWLVSNPNNRSSRFSNLRIETDQTLKCFAFSGSPVFEDMSFKFWEQAIYGSSQYNDLVKINRVTCSHITTPSTYQIEIQNTGDAVHLNQIHCFNVANDPATPLRSIKVTNNAVSIDNFIGGDIELVNCTALTSMRNIGMDGGKIILNKTHATLENIALSLLENEEVIQLENDTNFTRAVILDNVTLSHDIFRGAWEPYEFDIKVANGFTVDMRNTYRRIIASDNPSSRNLLGVYLSLESGAAFTLFNKYSHFYSTRCRIEDELIVEGNIDHPLPQTTLTIFTNLGAFASDSWDIASDTYYYKIVPYWDVARQVSRNISAERSLALTNGGDAAILEVGDGNYSGNMILRIYRGIAADTYNSYADVAVVDTPALVDNGNTISGIPWIARTPGPITSTPNSLNMLGFQFSMNNVNIKATAMPTQGTWSIGDRIINTAPAVDGNNMVLKEWLRITAGAGNVLNTDWVAQYVSTVTPAV